MIDNVGPLGWSTMLFAAVVPFIPGAPVWSWGLSAFVAFGLVPIAEKRRSDAKRRTERRRVVHEWMEEPLEPEEGVTAIFVGEAAVAGARKAYGDLFVEVDPPESGREAKKYSPPPSSA